MSAADLVAACRAAHREPFATQYDHRHLLAMAADEIERRTLSAKELAAVLCLLDGQVLNTTGCEAIRGVWERLASG